MISAFHKHDAPELALSLLESSGWTADPHAGRVPHAVHLLKNHVAAVALKSQAERIDAERLDAEALALLNAATGEHFSALPSTPNVADFWRAAARKAREIHR
jgi:hypothetical protein